MHIPNHLQVTDPSSFTTLYISTCTPKYMHGKKKLNNVEGMNWFGMLNSPMATFLLHVHAEYLHSLFTFFFILTFIYTCFTLTLSVTLGPFVLSAPRRPGTIRRTARAVSRSMMKANFLRRTSEIT